nr:hypothetical protein [Tanacetum cinerariifolium]
MDHSNPTFTKIRILDTEKFKQWKFRIQKCLQNEHYALWEVIEFGDSYKSPLEETRKGPSSESSARKKGRTVAITTEDILQATVSRLEFMDIEIKQDDLNQKFLTSLVPEWLMYTIVWRNRDDLDTMSLDDVYNHLKVYKLEVQKKSESNSQNMAFISSSNTNSGKGKVHTTSVPTVSIQVSTASIDVAVASLSHDTICFGRRLVRITIQGSDVAGFDKSKVECFNCHKMGHFSKECRAPRSQDRGKRESYKQGPKVEEPAPKALMAIDGIGWDWSYMANEEENHALIADDEVPTEFALMTKSSSSSYNKVYDDFYCSKSCRKNTKNLNTKISKLNEELSDYKNKEGLGYSAVPSPPAQIYVPHKKDLSWTGLPEFVDDTVTDYRRPTTSIDALKCNKSELQSSNFPIFEHEESTEHNTDFHQILDFLEASYISIPPRHAFLGVLHYGKPQTISESSLRRHLKLNDEEWISSLPDAELFEKLSLMGYNILPSQSLKSTGFNEFSSNIATAVVCLATNMVYNFSKMIFDGLMRNINRLRITQSKALSPDADEPASLLRDARYGDAFPIVSSLDAGQDRENIAKTSAMSHESSPRVPSLNADKGNKIKDQDIEISGLKARVKSLKDKERRCEEPIQKDAPIIGGIINIGEELRANKSTEKGSNNTEEIVNVLSSMEAVNILLSGGAAFSTASVSPTDVFQTAGVLNVSGSFPTAEEELKLMIEGLDRSNKVIAKHLSEYEQAEADLSVGEKIELISELVKYQDHLAEILKYQAQQSKPSSKKEQRKFYMSFLKSHAKWKTKHFRGMTLEKIKEKFIPV